MALLRRAFFERSAIDVALDLLGCELVRTIGPEERRGRIVEVEAYRGDGSDAASHSHRGRTQRNASMFGPAGRFYVYRSMGLHLCLNVVCEPAGMGAAVLLRAVEPQKGLSGMRRARSGRSDLELCRGPGKLTRAFDVELDWNGRSALRGALRIESGRPLGRECILAGPRIGISRATGLPWRFFAAEDPFVSRSPRNRQARPLHRGAA